MDIYEIVEKQRGFYIEDLIAFYKEQSNGEREVLLALNNNAPHEVFKLYRPDYIVVEDNRLKPLEFNSYRYLNFEPHEYSYSDMCFQLSPFHWNGCEFIFKNIGENISWLIEWVKKWIDEEDNTKEDEDGLQGVIHNVTYSLENEECRISIDFGTANVAAFWQLLDALTIAEGKHVKIGSFAMIQSSPS